MHHDAWETRAQRKRDAIFALIPPEWRLNDIPSPQDYPNVIRLPHDILLQDEILITEAPPLEILANITNSVWTAEEVTRAFCHRAAIAHQLVNCLTEICFDQAIATAKALDQYKNTTGKVKGPLHGLPMSFMDRYRIEGLETSSGFVSWLGNVETSKTESPMVSHLRKLGAVPFCKTNTPQGMLLGATANNVMGSTLNPYNRMLSAGGGAGGKTQSTQQYPLSP